MSFTLEMKNTTASFSLQNPSADLEAAYPINDESGLYNFWVYYPAEASRCDQVVGLSTTSLAPGQSFVVTGFFVVPNFYSPADPQGNLSEVNDAVFEIASNPPWEPSMGTSGLLPYTSTAPFPDHPGPPYNISETVPLVAFLSGTSPSCLTSGFC